MAQATTRPTTTITADYETRFAGSAEMHSRARRAIPGGITHDGRQLRPFPPYVTYAQGAHKWDVDGHELIDYAIGHGSLIFGHNDPEITAAMTSQIQRGTHYGAGHEGEIAWAEKIIDLLPSAASVRFTASGTEATLLAMRVARGATGRNTILKFEGHFHGWQDYALKGEKPPFERSAVPGIPTAALGTVAVVPANDAAMLEERLSQGDVAGVIIEPSGASWATIPLQEEFLQQVRALTEKYGAVLIFDEVITGFRWAPGGAQERFGVTPDLTTMAKIVAGGMPGGAVAGRDDLMGMLAFRDDKNWNSERKVPQAGTYNANPLAAAAGLACLTKCADPAVQARCDDLGRQIRAGINGVFARHDVPGFAWGESSIFHIAVGRACANRTDGDLRRPEGVSPEYLKASGGDRLAQLVEIGMLLEGVHLFHAGGFFSTAHTAQDVEHTVAAFDTVLSRIEDEESFA